LLDLNRLDEARPIAARLEPLRGRSQRAAQAMARLALADGSTQDSDVQSLEGAVRSDPGSLEARLALAKLYARERNYESALEQLMEVLRRNRRFSEDAARKTMLALFELLGNDHPLVGRYRRELAAVLH
jgi:putative thioredoxin